jgi:hypothetical protein
MNPRVTQITIVPEGEPIFSELGYTVKIEDNAAGEFIEVQDHSDDEGRISINPEDWPALRRAINRMAKNCRP